MDKGKLVTVDRGIPAGLKATSVRVQADDAKEVARYADSIASRNGYYISWRRQGGTVVGYCRKK